MLQIFIQHAIALLASTIGEHNARGLVATRWQNKKSKLQDNVTDE